MIFQLIIQCIAEMYAVCAYLSCYGKEYLLRIIKMEDLANGKCEVCRIGAPQLTREQMNEYIQVIPVWIIIQYDSINKLTRCFNTKNYLETMKFVSAVADVANSQDHHPVLQVEYNLVTVWWWTHKINGLHRNDFIMVAKTVEIFT